MTNAEKRIVENIRLVLAVSALVACLLPFAASADEPQAQIIEMKTTDAPTTDFGFGTCQWLYPLEAPKESLAAEPEYKSSPVYYAAVYGDAEDNVFTFAIDESGGSGTGYDTVYVDSNNDNRIDPDKERCAFSMSSVRREDPIRLKIEVTSGGKKAPYWFNFTAFPYTDGKNPVEKIHANLRNSSYYTGEAVFDGKTLRVALADLNSNGLFNDPEVDGTFKGDRFFIDLNDNDSFKDDRGWDASPGYPYGGYTKIAGRWYEIIASPDGSQVRIASAAPSLGLVEAPAVVASATLRSESQPCTLDFSAGPASGIAGAYRVRSITLRGGFWQTTAWFPEGSRPAVTIREGETVKLDGVGPPLRIEPTVSRGEESGTLEIGLEVTGRAGEKYGWPRGNGLGVKPGIKVRDEAGHVIFSVNLEYG